MDPASPPLAPAVPGEEHDELASAVGAEPQHSAAVDGRSEGDWDRRALCPDGSCVGIIGESGRCTVCGRSGAGEAAAPADISTGTEPRATAALEQVGAEHDDTWSRRRLCSDGACLGVLGNNDLCEVCGKAP